MIGNSPCRGRAPAVARDVFTGPLPRRGLPVFGCGCAISYRKSRLAGCDMSGGDLAIDRPDEARKFARDRSDSDGLALALPDQRSVARVEAALRLPGDLTHRWWGGVNLRLLGSSDPRGMLIAPGAFHQDAAGAPGARPLGW